LSEQETQKTLNFDNIETMMAVFGQFDEYIRILEEETGAKAVVRGSEVRITGDDQAVQMARTIIERLMQMSKTGEPIDKGSIRYIIHLAKNGRDAEFSELLKDVVCLTHKGKPIKCKTLGQKRYVDAIVKSDVVFSIGPAGTGKTYLAMAKAVSAFKDKQVDRIVLTRPAVEAGEKLGFLPGDLQNKVDPYLRPLYDALHDLMGLETYSKLIERGTIEVAPLAYMRGRTLNDSFIILDEAQNTTSEQMKMFLTRLGVGSKAVITGDITQIDLPEGKRSGLIEAQHILKGVSGISIVQLTHRDVVRHELVMAIIQAYDRHNKQRNAHRS
jgi:phosphate starvation-inducible PhoH-like protein